MATVEQADSSSSHLTVPKDDLHEHHGHGPAPGETAEQHAAHAQYAHHKHWGLGRRSECALFYLWALPSWFFEIAAAAIGPYLGTASYSFIATCTIWLVLWATAWFQTTVTMIQRASWLRDEANLKDRKQYLFLSVRLQRLMLPTAIIAFVAFIVAYPQRHNEDKYAHHHTSYWLIFLLFFIFNTVGCVMNAYNNITWETDRLHYEEGTPPMKYARLAILGIPSSERGLFRYDN